MSDRKIWLEEIAALRANSALYQTELPVASSSEIRLPGIAPRPSRGGRWEASRRAASPPPRDVRHPKTRLHSPGRPAHEPLPGGPVGLWSGVRGRGLPGKAGAHGWLPSEDGDVPGAAIGSLSVGGMRGPRAHRHSRVAYQTFNPDAHQRRPLPLFPPCKTGWGRLFSPCPRWSPAGQRSIVFLSALLPCRHVAVPALPRCRADLVVAAIDRDQSLKVGRRWRIVCNVVGHWRDTGRRVLGLTIRP
jgi:hypothetical protein